MDQNYKSENVIVNNSTSESIKSRWPSVPMFVLGFLAALQIIQVIIMLLLYQYVLRVEDRFDKEVKDSRSEIIQLWKKG